MTTNAGSLAGKELDTSSVTSSGFESYIGTDPFVLAGFEQALTILIDDANYLDASHRGYVMAMFSNSTTRAEWRYVATIAAPTVATVVGHSETIS